MRAYCFTGHVLDSNYEVWSSHRKDKEVFSVFNTLDEAISYIDLQKHNYPNAEYIINNHNQELIYEHHPEETSSLPEHNLGLKFVVWPSEMELFEELQAQFKTWDEAIEYIIRQKHNYPNAEFKIRDHSQNIIYTYDGDKSKGLFGWFYRLLFIIGKRR